MTDVLGTAVPGLSFAVTLAVYSKTLYASIPGGDSGELVAEACKLGHAHPPGYPLFTLIYHFMVEFSGFDFVQSSAQANEEPIAWRANLLSSVLGALSVSLLFFTIKLMCEIKFGKDKPNKLILAGCTFGSLMYSFSDWIWMYNVGAEVFALNNFFTCLILFLTVSYAKHQTEVYISLGAFCCGLALCNQHTIVLFEFPLILWILYTQIPILTKRKFLKYSIFFLIGLLPYAYLPIASTFFKQRGSWGDSSTLSGFLHHLRRGDYGTFRLFSSDKQVDGMFYRIYLYFCDLQCRQGMHIIPFFAVCGSLISLSRFPFTKHKSSVAPKIKAMKKLKKVRVQREEKKEVSKIDTQSVDLALIATFWFYMLVFHFLANMPLNEELLYGVQARFWMQPNSIVFLFSGVGFTRVAHQLGKHIESGLVVDILALLIAVLFVSMQCSRNYRINDQSKNWFMEQYGRSLIESVPKNSLLLTNYDQQWTTIRYLQQCLGVRKDVLVMNLSMMTYRWLSSYKQTYYPDLILPANRLVHANSKAHLSGEAFLFKDFLDANMGNFPGGIYVGGNVPYIETDKTYKGHYTSFNFGMLSRWVPLPKSGEEGIEGYGFDKWIKETSNAWEKVNKIIPVFPKIEKYSAETWEWTIPRDYFRHLQEFAAEVLDVGIKRKDLKLISKAAADLERCFTEDREYMQTAVAKNLGLAYQVLLKDPKFKKTDGVNPLAHLKVPESKWRDTAALRIYETWSYFVTMEGAETDPSYKEILRVVNILQELDKKKKLKK